MIEQLQGLELAAGEWEASVLPARLVHYDPKWLDELCLSGEVAWGRLSPRPEVDEGSRNSSGTLPAGDRAAASAFSSRRGSATPSASTPIAVVGRQDLAWLLAAVRTGSAPVAPTSGPSADLLAVLRAGGASFRAELHAGSGRLDTEVDEGLWDLVARGMVTADAFSALRALLTGRGRRRAAGRRAVRRSALGRQRTPLGTGTGEGRWSVLAERDPSPSDGVGGGRARVLDGPELEELAELVAFQLLARWGVMAYELWSKESFRVPWREVVRALRRLEARGLALGGRFVAGLSGEQYALPEAAALLSDVAADPEKGADVSVSGSDPLNLTGSLLGNARVPALRRRTVTFVDGLPVDAATGDRASRPVLTG